MKREHGFILFSLFLIIIGIVLIVLGSNELALARDSEDWPSTTGIVVETHIIEDYDSDDERYYYYADVNYEFSVDGINYTSDDIYVGTGFGRYYSESLAEGVLEDYPVGSEVIVYYNPANSALIPGVKATHYSGITGGILLILISGISLIIFIYAIIMEKKKKIEYKNPYKIFSEDIHKRICRECGMALSAENEYCDECGTPVEN